MNTITNEIKEYWHNFLDESPNLSYLREEKIQAWGFGNTADMADRLGALVVEGKKTATCGLFRAYIEEKEAIPSVGSYHIICNGENHPLCIIRLHKVFICKFEDVGDDFAYLEGEGDRSLEYWRQAHRKFFSQYDNFSEEEELVCEEFNLVYK